jgi:hypothetical protein
VIGKGESLAPISSVIYYDSLLWSCGRLHNPKNSEIA